MDTRVCLATVHGVPESDTTEHTQGSAGHILWGLRPWGASASACTAKEELFWSGKTKTGGLE